MRGQFTAIATVMLLSGSLVWKAEAPTWLAKALLRIRPLAPALLSSLAVPA
jgi:hypothetical protein